MTNGPENVRPWRRITAALIIVVLLGVALLIAALTQGSGAPKVVTFDCDASGETIVVCAPGAGGSDLYAYAASSPGTPRRLTSTSAAEYSPALSPDGRWVAFGRQPRGRHEGSLWLLDLTTGEERRLTHEDGVDDSRPRFTRDGATIWFVRAFLWRRYSMGGWIWDNHDVCTVPARSGPVRRLTHRAFRSLTDPVVTSDGRTVIFSATTLGDERMVTYRAPVPQEGGSLALTRIGTGAGALPVGTGGTCLVISDADKPYNYQVCRLSPDGTSHPLTSLRGGVSGVALGANDSRLLVLVELGGGQIGYDLVAYDISGGLDKALPEPRTLVTWRW